VDRAAVAKIVFADEREKHKLEGLVHPVIHAERATAIKAAAASGAAAVIIDAPLLFEAGVDKECDAVVFIDAPYEERLRRVREGRGWDEQELLRRERAQMPLEEKKARSSIVINNSGDLADLEGAVASALEEVAARVGERGRG
jgi:dephospho-CoA kinase